MNALRQAKDQPVVKDERNEQDLSEALKDLEREFGKGAVFTFSGKRNTEQRFVPTGSLALDRATGGGYPRGRFTEIFGAESAGKTTLALHAIAECQKAGGRAAFIDAEHALDIKYAKSLGINLAELLLAQPDSGEQGLSILEALARTGKIDLVVVDSVAALVPQIELDGEMSDQTIGAHARLMSKALRILTGLISKNDTAVIFINQIRERVGIVYGSPEITTGGRALKFYASLRMDVRKEGLIKDGESNIGLRSRITIVKNKSAAPFETAHINIYFGKGFDYSSEVVEQAVTSGVIEKSGSWYAYNKTNLGQGLKQVRDYLSGNSELYEKIKSLTLARLDEPNHSAVPKIPAKLSSGS